MLRVSADEGGGLGWVGGWGYICCVADVDLVCFRVGIYWYGVWLVL